MADSLATYTRDIVVDLPDFPAGEVKFWLATTFAAAMTASRMMHSMRGV